MRKKIFYNLVIVLSGLILAGFLGYFIFENEFERRRPGEQAFVPETIDIDTIEDDQEFAESIPEYRILFDGLVQESRELTFARILDRHGQQVETKVIEGIRSDGEKIEIEYTGLRLGHILNDLLVEDEAMHVIAYATDLYAADFTMAEFEDAYLVWKKEGQYLNPTQDGLLKIVLDGGPTNKWVKNPVLFSFISIFEDMVSEYDRMDAEWLEFASEQSMFTLSIGPVPEIDIEDWRLAVEGLVDNPLVLDYGSLKEIGHESVYATLETISNPPGGGAIGNAVWAGAPFSKIIEMAGPEEGVYDVIFYCEDGYSTSITLEEAGQPGVLLAYEMNGRTLAQEHGFPARMVVPSKYGMKWAMWINRIEFVDYDYKGFWESRGWSDYAGRDRPDVRFD